jgi:hypothetical protein
LSSSLESALKIAEDQRKEVELTIKVTVSTTHEVDNDKMISWIEPNVDYKVVRKIKESKFDFNGSIKKSAMKIIDGEVVIAIIDEKKPSQLNLFDMVDEKYHV